MPPYLTPKPKVLGAPNLACVLVFSKFFLEKQNSELITSSFWAKSHRSASQESRMQFIVYYYQVLCFSVLFVRPNTI